MSNAELIALADRMLISAQTLRIQQVQACNEGEWGEKYKAIADCEWAELNRVHKAIVEALGAQLATPPTPGLTSYIDPLTAKWEPESDEDLERLRARFLVLYRGPVPPPELHVDFGAGGKKAPADAFVPLPPPEKKVNFREFL